MKTKLVLAALIVMAAASYSFAAEWQASVSSGSVTVYSRMTKSSTRVGILGKGTPVIVEWINEDMESKWCGIRKLDSSYTLGYVECKFLTSGNAANDALLISGELRPYSDISVILYSAPWCGYCKQAEHMLEDMGVHLIEFDIEKDRSRGKEMHDKGGRGVPFIDVEGTYIGGYAPERIKQVVEDRRRR